MSFIDIRKTDEKEEKKLERFNDVSTNYDRMLHHTSGDSRLECVNIKLKNDYNLHTIPHEYMGDNNNGGAVIIVNYRKSCYSFDFEDIKVFIFDSLGNIVSSLEYVQKYMKQREYLININDENTDEQKKQMWYEYKESTLALLGCMKYLFKNYHINLL